MRGLLYMILLAFAVAIYTGLSQSAQSMELSEWRAALISELENPVIGPPSPIHNDAIRYTLAQMTEYNEGKSIIVNVPEFTLYAMENGREVFRSKVIIGKSGTKSGGATPMIDTNVVGFTYNPSWTPTPSITKKKLALWAKDPSYMEKHHIGIYDRDGHKIDSTASSPSEFRENGYHLWQRPGEHNALGKFKFVLDNRQNIYMHDTDERGLFSKERRAFSSGCVRVESWSRLASWVSGMNEDEIQRKLSQGNHGHSVVPVPVHIVYWPATVAEDGSVKIHRDIYKRLPRRS